VDGSSCTGRIVFGGKFLPPNTELYDLNQLYDYVYAGTCICVKCNSFVSGK